MQLMVQDRALLAGASVLVVEDEILIAMDVEQTLTDLGAADVRIAATVPEALASIAGSQPTLAVLDFGLGDQTSIAIADELCAHRIPFVLVTGYSEGLVIPPQHSAAPLVEKPVDPNVLEATIARLLGRRIEITPSG